jgi:hypothetical protein
MTDEDSKYLCQMCYGEQVPYARAMRCIKDKVSITCAQCGEAAARQVKRCVVPMNKVAYMMVTDLETLKQLNPKRTT